METRTDTPNVETRTEILSGLRRLIATRSGIDRRNYQRDYRDAEGAAAFRADYRTIARDGRDARRLLAWVETRAGITADDIGRRAGPGDRLSLSADRTEWNYCAGQYFATEYRAAVCRMLSAVIRDYFREGGYTGDEIARVARREFGRGIASRYF